MHIHHHAHDKGQDQSNTAGLVHHPEHKGDGQYIRHPILVPKAQQHVQQQGQHQSQPDEAGVGGQQQMATCRHDHGVPPVALTP